MRNLSLFFLKLILNTDKSQKTDGKILVLEINLFVKKHIASTRFTCNGGTYFN